MDTQIIIFLKKLWEQGIAPTLSSLISENKKNSDRIINALQGQNVSTKQSDLLERNLQEITRALAEKSNDSKPVVNAIERLSAIILEKEDAPEKEETEKEDIKVEVDTTKLEKLFKKLFKKEPSNLKFDDKGRVLVNVDRAGGSESTDVSGLLTEATGQQMLAVLIQIRDGGVTPTGNFIVTETGDTLVDESGNYLVYA